MNCIYIITCKELERDNLYKIGFSKNLEKRKRAYKTCFPSKVQVKYMRAIEEMKRAEKDIHIELKRYSYRKGGGNEWFQGDIDFFMSVSDTICNNLEKNYEEKPSSFFSRFKNWILCCCCFKNENKK